MLRAVDAAAAREDQYQGYPLTNCFHRFCGFHSLQWSRLMLAILSLSIFEGAECKQNQLSQERGSFGQGLLVRWIPIRTLMSLKSMTVRMINTKLTLTTLIFDVCNKIKGKPARSGLTQKLILDKRPRLDTESNFRSIKSLNSNISAGCGA